LPDQNDEYLIYQTLVGTWPIEPDRVLHYARKAVREAKRRTAWTTGNEEYDRAVDAFVDGILLNQPFLDDMQAFISPLMGPWRITSLAHTLLHMTAAGVPQIYGGDELWYLSLVDPDNRRPVDFSTRRGALAGAAAQDGTNGKRIQTTAAEVSRDELGVSKLRVVRAALDVRRRYRGAFAPGSQYAQLMCYGPKVRHAVAFERFESAQEATDRVVCVVPRLVIALKGEWDGTTVQLPPGRFINVFTGGPLEGMVRLEELLATFPAALLVSV
jgi:(1->4)-alpha-D-glucan 1-alpha-D-glucosylmutase